MLLLVTIALLQTSPAQELWKQIMPPHKEAEHPTSQVATESQADDAPPFLTEGIDRELPMFEPAREIVLPGWSVEEPVLSGAGDSVYAIVPQRAVNLWALLGYYWPELLGGLSAVLVLAALVVIRRVARYPQLPGKPHCRKCGYCLAGLTSDRCPECGTPPNRRRPVIGRTARRRTGPIVAVTSVMVVAYAALWALQVGRTGRFSNWLEIWSEEWLERGVRGDAGFLSPTILKFAESLDAVVEYDLATGQQRRVVTRTPGPARNKSFGITPDGRFLVMRTKTRDVLNVVRTSDGRVTQRLNLPDSSPQSGTGPRNKGVFWDHLAGFSEDGRSVFAVKMDMDRPLVTMFECDLESGSTRELFQAPAHEYRGTGTALHVAGDFLVVPGSSPRRVFELIDAPKPVAGSTDLHRPVAYGVLRDMDHGGALLQELPSVFWPYGTPAFTPDGRYMYLQDSTTIVEPTKWDLETGKQTTRPRRRLSQGGGVDYSTPRPSSPLSRRTFSAGDVLAYCATRNRVYIVCHNPECEQEPWVILVHDQGGRRFLAQFRYRHRIAPRRLQVSQDGSWLVVRGQLRQGKSVLSDVLSIYDLRGIAAVEATASPAP